jgi:hypothetical protein
MSSGVTHVCLSARKPFLAVVSLKAGPPVVVELSKEQPTVTPLDGIDLKGEARLQPGERRTWLQSTVACSSQALLLERFAWVPPSCCSRPKHHTYWSRGKAVAK